MPSQHETAFGKYTQDALRLTDLDHAGWVWEWLRRNPRYRADVAMIGSSGVSTDSLIVLDPLVTQRAQRWGLHFRRGPLRPRQQR